MNDNSQDRARSFEELQELEAKEHCQDVPCSFEKALQLEWRDIYELRKTRETVLKSKENGEEEAKETRSLPPEVSGVSRKLARKQAGIPGMFAQYFLEPTQKLGRDASELLGSAWDELKDTFRKTPPAAEAELPSEEDKTPKEQRRLVGLAFSGGGIRSATFNLGVLQALAELKLLPKFDYLSTVSGGGYIGSWLVAWIKRAGLAEVMRRLRPERPNVSHGRSGWAPEEPAIQFLRSYSNYLTPRRGLMGADTWAAVASYLRNLVLNQLILVFALASLLLLPRLLFWGSGLAALHPWLVLGLIFILVLSAVLGIGWNMALFNPPRRLSLFSTEGKITFYILHLLPLLLAMIFLVLPWFIEGVGEVRLLALIFLGATYLRFRRTISALLRPPVGKPAAWAGQRGVSMLIVVPLVLAAWLILSWLCVGLKFSVPSAGNAGVQVALLSGLFGTSGSWRGWVVFGLFAYGLPWLLGTLAGVFDDADLDGRLHQRLGSIVVGGFVAGAVGGLVTSWLLDLLRLCKGTASQFWLALTIGAPAVLLVFTLVATLHIGMMGRQLAEEKREWWARLGGLLLRCSLVWLVLFGISVYGPLVPHWIQNTWARAGLGLGWAITTLGGLLAGRSEKTNGGKRATGLDLVGKVAPYVFIAGLLVALSIGVNQFFIGRLAADAASQCMNRTDVADCAFPYEDVPNLTEAAEGKESEATLFPASARRPNGSILFHWCIMTYASTDGIATVGLTWLASFLLALILSWRIDVNEFSMHYFYRNRLVRCYLGASRAKPPRQPNPFTGFDRDDDILLADLSVRNPMRPEEREKKLSKKEYVRYSGPYPIVNVALNLMQGKQLAWQNRKASSFVFTPRLCGFHLTRPDGKIRAESRPGFRRTESYLYHDGGPYLGTAMAISGAAASPNMGYHTSVPLAFLMTVFNVRLGWWAGNPLHHECWKRPSPRLGLSYLLTELAGAASAERGYVYLSDGGHFENLGIYELVRRRCRLILACDGAADPDVKFGDLGNAIEKCRTDFGVNIEIDTSTLKPPAGSRYSQWHCVVGRIHYGKGEVGTLIYLKSSLTGDEPSDVQAYAAENPDFPQQTTADQFFDESQFESYRALGYHAATSAFEFLGNADHIAGLQTEQIAIEMRQRWHPPSSATEEQFTKHTATLRHIFTTLRENSDLRFLDEQVYLEWPPMLDNDRRQPNLWLPIGRDSEPKLRAGFYLCNEMIQLMEDVYTDLKLETECDHPDNRGWMNLFKHWSWSGMFRVTWAICAGTYGARFQEFCRRRLDLEIGEVQVGDPIPLPPPDAEEEEWERPSIAKRFNFLEIELMRDSVAKMRGKCAACPLEIQVRDSDDKSKKRSFVYGFCIVRTSADEPGWEICYFRVQDHLRRMGLARKALRELLTQGKARGGTRLAELVSSQLPTAEGQKFSEEDRRRFEALFYSVTHEV